MYQELLKQKMDLGMRRPFKKETIQTLKRLNALDYIYGAMALEGTELSRRTVEGMMDGEMPKNVALKDCVFIKNYLNTLELMQDCLALKCCLDKRLLLRFYSSLTGSDPGFRRSDMMAVDFKHVPPHHSEVESRLTKLLQAAYKVGANEIHRAAAIHCGIMDIWPFEKYNGIMARLAMNYYLEEKGFWPVTLGYNRREYIKTMIECLKDKDDKIFFWGLERAEYNKMAQVLQIVAMEEDEDEE